MRRLTLNELSNASGLIKALQKLYEKVACLHVDIFNGTYLVLCILSKFDRMNISRTCDMETVKEVCKIYYDNANVLSNQT